MTDELIPVVPDTVSEPNPDAASECIPDAASGLVPDGSSEPVSDAASEPIPDAVSEDFSAIGRQETAGDGVGPAPVAAPASGPAAVLRICAKAQTDMGCVRTNNEDAYGYDEAGGVYVICDGMGGGPSGEVASATAVETIVNSFASSAASGHSVGARLLGAIEEANAAVWAAAQTEENKGMGTTTVAIARDGNSLIVGNVGDSRAYLLKGGRCTQLTVDHSYLNELIRNGTLTLENAHTADLRGMESVICRAVGVAPTVEPDFFSVELEHGTAVLMATDGLTRYMLQDEILSVIAAASSLDTACANLIAVAKERGGVDNITCLLLLAVHA